MIDTFNSNKKYKKTNSFCCQGMIGFNKGMVYQYGYLKPVKIMSLGLPITKKKKSGHYTLYIPVL